MNEIRITKIFTFEMAHALSNYDGKCKNVHGHSYKLFVTIKGKPINEINNKKNGMVMDFGDLKKIVNSLIINNLDHAILLNNISDQFELGKYLQKNGHKVVWTNYQPTCENMLLDFAQKIQQNLPNNIILEKLKLFETENSYGEWLRKDNLID